MAAHAAGTRNGRSTTSDANTINAAPAIFTQRPSGVPVISGECRPARFSAPLEHRLGGPGFIRPGQDAAVRTAPSATAPSPVEAKISIPMNVYEWTTAWYRPCLSTHAEVKGHDQHDASNALASPDAAAEPRRLRGVRGVFRAGRPDLPVLRQR